MTHGLLAVPVLAAWRVIDLAARLAVRVWSASERAAATEHVAVPVPTAIDRTVLVHPASARERRASLLLASSGECLPSVR
ncbi:hypothetical protein SAMN05661080_04637 [Modestobacter sp. DSM 44400]|uniref:hypothetical protein n=1 Tax=Modestobacter sp. DSM 44400 TaxID=1550230 RepID=UPI00089CD710|nr:hypothetical protein [Modestobacter sp. DSM 44400]SDY79688.1 hypothetical protein SAMN05661080_04637 [Modestobacter sp. DSM 44400]